MIVRSLPLLCLVAGAAACVVPVAPGPGTIGDEAIAKRKSTEEAARLAAVRRACAVANERALDLRMQRKAAELTAELAHTLDEDDANPSRSDLLALVEPVLARMDQGDHRCVTVPEAARTFEALGEDSKAATRFALAATECQDTEFAIAASRAFRRAGHCNQAIAVVRDAFASAEREHWIEIFDAVNHCSDAVTLRDNLSFVPEPVLGDYFDLLRQREAEERERQRQYQLEELARRADDRRRSAEFSCESDCSQAVSSCYSSCQGDSSCNQRCDAVGSACRSGCHTY